MELSEDKVRKYRETTRRAISGVSVSEEGSFDWTEMAKQFIDMADRYHRDACYYMDQGDLVTAFAACNYAHGWIDAGVRLGLLIAEEGSEEYIMPK